MKAEQIYNELVDMNIALKEVDIEVAREMLLGLENEIDELRDAYKNEIAKPDLLNTNFKHEIDTLMSKLFGCDFMESLCTEIAVESQLAKVELTSSIEDEGDSCVLVNSDEVE